MSNRSHRVQFLRKFELDPKDSYSLSQLSVKSKVPVGILQEVYNRGIGAYNTNIESVRLKKDFSKNPNPAIPASARLTKEQWAFARVYSFLNRGKTYKTADADLALKARY